ncbi:MAG: hypothetical protein Q9210_004361 [Variospora velana]
MFSTPESNDTHADYVHFLASHESIRRVLGNKHTVAMALKRVAPYSKEYDLVATKLLTPETALRMLYNRQRAFATAKPSSVIVLGDGRSFLYRQGILVYVRGYTIRILDVFNASKREGVLFPRLIGNQILAACCMSTEVELYNVQDGLLTFMFHGETQTVGWRSWVLVIDADYQKDAEDLDSDRVRLAVDLWTPEDIFVRNTTRYICFISPTGSSVNGRHREWVCKVWDLNEHEPRPMAMQIPELAVSELGQGLVFEIFGEYLYAVSTQSAFEMDEPEWTSFYTCYRFPLNNPHPLTLEKLRIWRRHHQEGPINDLWTDLKLHKDELTGKLFIIEARKEWTGGRSAQSRTWYRQELPAQFLYSEVASDDDDDNDDEDMAVRSNQGGDVHQPSGADQSHDLASSSSSTQDPPYLLVTLPNDLERRPGHRRLPHNTQPEYPSDAPAPPAADSFILAKSKHRAYNPSASAFLDIVVDDRQPSGQSKWAQQIRFRIGSRCEASPLNSEGMVHEHDSELRYVDQGINVWPPSDAPTVLQDLLNGNVISDNVGSDGFTRKTLGEITAISDERSIVYLVKEKGALEDAQGQLILVNFDQHIHFLYQKWTPVFIDLQRSRHNPDSCKADIQPMEQIAVEGMLKMTYEPMIVDDDDYEADQEDDEDEEMEEGSDENDGEKIMPADDTNDYSMCESIDDGEPVEIEWLIEERAMWTYYRRGFRFVKIPTMNHPYLYETKSGNWHGAL